MRSSDELLAGLDFIRQSPKNAGTLELIVRRPRTGTREVIEEGSLDPEHGLIGDNWLARGNFWKHVPASREKQITIMNARAAALVAMTKDQWPLAGDQLYVDLDLSGENVPPGTELAIGTVLLVVSAKPHTGCKKFVSRFGIDAMTFVNSPIGRELNLRGINARVARAGTIRTGDQVIRLA